MKFKVVINVKDTENAIEAVEAFKKKKYEGKDIRFTNVNMISLNEKFRKKLFSKNDLFIDSTALWEMMQDIGGEGAHHFHGFSSKDIIDALVAISEPYAIIEVEYERHAVITTAITHFNEQIMIIIKIGSRIYSQANANINKLITMYPKSDVDKTLSKIDKKSILYKK